MDEIKDLFDPNKGIDRQIDTVISFQENKNEKLKTEILEYMLTDSIDKQLEKLLTDIDSALDSGGGHEIGVGFQVYGSGKVHLQNI